MSRTDTSNQSFAWFVVLMLTFLLAAALRVAGLDSSLWYDEIITLVQSVRHPVRQILTEFPGVNTHPLYSLLAHGSIAAFGESAWALRLPACVFGVASVMMVYVFAAGLMTRVEAWAASAVLATSYHHIWFSQNARGYTAMGFLTLLSTCFLLRAQRTGRRADYVVYALACVAGIYTHLTMAFVVGGHVLVTLSARGMRWHSSTPDQPLRPLLRAWSGVAVLSAAVYAPYLNALVAVMQAAAPRQAAAVATPGWALGEALRSLLSGAGLLAGVIAGGFAAIGAVSMYRRHPVIVALLVVPAVLTGMTIVALHQPLRPRFFFFLSGAAAMFIGRGIGVACEALLRRTATLRLDRLPAAIAAAAMLLIAISAAALPRNYRLPKQDFDSAVQFLTAAEAQGAQIAASGPACLPVAIYYGKMSWPCLNSVDDWRDLAGTDRRLLMVYTLPDYLDPMVRNNLRANCPPVHVFEGTLGGGDIVVCEAGGRGQEGLASTPPSAEPVTVRR